ncbi:MAG: hypothetical protein EON59_13570 [Alphaproteobacteria bacterium]|nr:MAG: hypothetical protein EON59_13570 [Alphaproteobacteria bacterium]
MSAYIETVSEILAETPLSFLDDPLWKAVKDFAVSDIAFTGGECAIPRPMAPLRKWTPFVLRDRAFDEIAGCWWIFSLTGTGTQNANPGVAVSLLNIRPKSFHDSQKSDALEFLLFLGGLQPEMELSRIEGVCHHYNQQLYLMGFLDRDGKPFPASMVLGWDPGGRISSHWERTSGALFMPNSLGQQITAPITAIYIEGSSAWEGDVYHSKRKECFQRLGPHAHRVVADILPEPIYQSLVERMHERVFDPTLLRNAWR